jgi:hypothetical protein
MLYISPYADFSHLWSGSAGKEKHACTVVHKIPSMTLEKRGWWTTCLVSGRSSCSRNLWGMLIRHLDMFYVSLKGDRDLVFLREAYKNSQLMEKSHLVLLKEKMRALVTVPRFPRRGGPRTGEKTEEWRCTKV